MLLDVGIVVSEITLDTGTQRIICLGHRHHHGNLHHESLRHGSQNLRQSHHFWKTGNNCCLKNVRWRNGRYYGWKSVQHYDWWYDPYYDWWCVQWYDLPNDLLYGWKNGQ